MTKERVKEIITYGYKTGGNVTIHDYFEALERIKNGTVERPQSKEIIVRKN